uniref:Uncharacterized protein n=1 Tax=Moniliophthora roreri TaxID=221103 RepID=A0A0W0FVU3_MONRR
MSRTLPLKTSMNMNLIWTQFLISVRGHSSVILAIV